MQAEVVALGLREVLVRLVHVDVVGDDGVVAHRCSRQTPKVRGTPQVFVWR